MDSQTMRCDLFGQGQDFAQRVYVIYDGIHYDPLAFAFDSELPADMDVTIFNPKDEFVHSKALELTKDANKAIIFYFLAHFLFRNANLQTLPSLRFGVWFVKKELWDKKRLWLTLKQLATKILQNINRIDVCTLLCQGCQPEQNKIKKRK
jgi:hypothetical protein